jgi:RNA polymerase sigma-70 factor (ECF subfamily)
VTETESEETLVERAKEDPVAFGILYQKYVRKIYSYIYCRTGNRQDAEDLTARTFYRALANVDRYKSRGFPFSAWLYRIAHNLVANWLRDRSRHPAVSLDQLPSTRWRGTTAIEDHAEANEEREALLEAIRRLHPDRQQLLILKLMEGMSNVEIGQVLGRSEGAIKSLYFRTLIALREDMEKRGF